MMDILLSKIREFYGLRLCVVEKVSGGYLSQNYILSDGTVKYFFKKYRFDNERRVKEVHAAKKYFFDSGIPVIVPLPGKSGKTYFECGGRYYAIFPFVCGLHMKYGAPKDGEIISYGEMLGRLHLVGKKSVLSIGSYFKPMDREESLRKIAKLIKKIHENEVSSDFDKTALESLSLKKELIATNDIQYDQLGLKNDHLIHGDYLYHNVFFNDSLKVSHVFDFEKTAYYPRCFEIFRSMFYSFPIEGNGPLSLQYAKLYLDSYSRAYPISNEEIRNGLRMLYLHNIYSLWIESEHYLWGNRRIDLFLIPEKQRIEYLSKHKKELEEFFSSN